MYTQTALKQCHSAISSEIFYDERRPECRQCPQRGECLIATQKRVGGIRPQASSSLYGTPVRTVQPAPIQQVQGNTGPILLFDPMPLEGESVLTRALKNGFQAAGISFVEECVFLARRIRW